MFSWFDIFCLFIFACWINSILNKILDTNKELINEIREIRYKIEYLKEYNERITTQLEKMGDKLIDINGFICNYVESKDPWKIVK